MSNVKLKNISKIYPNGFKAVDGINLDINDKEFIVLVGPSGCGKSTTLRMIAGLEEISDGELYIDDELVNLVEPKNRDIAMVFQSYALYPHISVRDNIAFALKVAGVKKDERYKKVDEVAKILQLEPVLNKKPGTLSGGQRQRVALGRAMVRDPKVFLFDEPLSNLDAKLRVAMRGEIVALHKNLETTFIYVTHDQTEAMTMGDRIAVMNEGIVEQFDTPGNLYHNPKNLFVAAFIGSPQMNFYDASLINDGNNISVNLWDKVLNLPESIKNRLNLKNSHQDIVLGIRSENIYYADSKGESTINVIAKKVEQLGSDTYVYFDTPASKNESVARFNPPRNVSINEEIGLNFDLEKIIIFDKETGLNILKTEDISYF
ncbi:ABC transporter ATP-binding protein [Anaerococcus sp. Marseille-Q5996]|uniref:ABC transporter ATP-binding protein n=1 Tax=Anaerococcus sp. Marseille-Q5996 TaxID=2972769 RepID=UPI0021C65CF1|nr:sn-glycerol-3-phosphate ABC transporter ATP-binding protein UgpC [Anaerococcus sp. Marseille-Q5996]